MNKSGWFLWFAAVLAAVLLAVLYWPPPAAG